MTDAISHRGPDDSGYFFNQLENCQIGFGHRRLSIIDLSELGHQPMAFEHLTLIYNGETYNYKEVRDELIDLGYFFKSESDTEVILKAFHKWGTKCIDKFNGMFALAIFDSILGKLYLIRDRAGVKPIFYYFKDGLFLFSSELKSFHKHPNFQKSLNPDGLALYLQFGYIPQPHTIFEDTYKLDAGSILELNLLNKDLKISKYWDVFDFYNKPKLDISENEAINKIQELMISACEYRMVSDVPVGMFLSGGYDSSTVAAILQSSRSNKIKTFTIGFEEEKFNEAPHAKKIAEFLGTDHTEYYCKPSDAKEILPLLPEIWDEPFADDSVIPTTLVSKLAREQVTVSLSADGGDELFGGYDKYTFAKNISEKTNKLPFKSLIGKTFSVFQIDKILKISNSPVFESKMHRGFSFINAKNQNEILKNIQKIILDTELPRILKLKYKNIHTAFENYNLLNENNSPLDKLMAVDFNTYQLDDILTKVDRATMHVSLEGREPLLDYRLIEFVAQLDSKLKVKNGNKKHLLKQITHKYIPQELMDRPKMGFSTPIKSWFNNELEIYLDQYFNYSFLTNQGVFSPDELLKLKKSYLAGNTKLIYKIWNILVFQLWYEKWMN